MADDQGPRLKPSNIWLDWPYVEPVLDELCRKYPAAISWQPGDILEAVRQNEAIYFATDDGFAVCKLEWDEYDSRPDFYVWVAFGLPAKRGGLLRKYLPFFIEVAEYLECRAVRWLACHETKGKPGRVERCGTEYRVLVDGPKGQQTAESSAESG